VASGGSGGGGGAPSTTICGDDKCTGAETCSSCARDCGSCGGAGGGAGAAAAGAAGGPPTTYCGDNKCSVGETCANCAQDCGECCGNGKCDDTETWESCTTDCKKPDACQPVCKSITVTHECYCPCPVICVFCCGCDVVCPAPETHFAWTKCGGQEVETVSDCDACKPYCDAGGAHGEGWYLNCAGTKKFLYTDDCSLEN
jgi:hypothetical protein